MTGADIVGELLRGYAPLTAEVPAESIKGGRLGQVVLPAVLVRTISGSTRQRLRRGGTDRCLDRVSVTVRARSYDEQLRIIDLVFDACADRQGGFAGAARASVLSAGRGPDLDGPGNTYEQAQDFRVSFDKPVSRGE